MPRLQAGSTEGGLTVPDVGDWQEFAKGLSDEDLEVLVLAIGHEKMLRRLPGAVPGSTVLRPYRDPKPALPKGR
jgi:hypothetical protein